jgi:hypothetical protein
VKRLSSLKHGRAVGDEVLDNKAGPILNESDLDGSRSSIILDLLAAHEHGGIVGNGDAGSDRERSVGTPQTTS